MLAAAIDDIHTEYKMRDKVIKTATGNSTNFYKSIKQFLLIMQVLKNHYLKTLPQNSLGEDNDQIDYGDSDFELVSDQTSSNLQYTNIKLL